MKVGFLGLLTLIFVVCKLAGIITWSWWLVFLPTIIAVIFGVLIWGLILAAAWAFA